ncbi:MAG: DoxX family protein [Kofleriaceae bacterium]
MKFTLARLEPVVYGVLRMIAGAMFACHGLQKVFGILGGHAVALRTQMGIGGVIELVTGVLIAIGVGTRWAAFFACGQMAVAYFQFHAPHGVLPIQTNADDTVLYCFVFLLFCVRGSGVYAIRPD